MIELTIGLMSKFKPKQIKMLNENIGKIFDTKLIEQEESKRYIIKINGKESIFFKKRPLVGYLFGTIDETLFSNEELKKLKNVMDPINVHIGDPGLSFISSSKKEKIQVPKWMRIGAWMGLILGMIFTILSFATGVIFAPIILFLIVVLPIITFLLGSKEKGKLAKKEDAKKTLTKITAITFAITNLFALIILATALFEGTTDGAMSLILLLFALIIINIILAITFGAIWFFFVRQK